MKPLWIAVLVTADIVSVGTCIERILGIDLVGTVIALILYEDVGHIVLLVTVLTLLASLWQIKLAYDQRTLARELAARQPELVVSMRDEPGESPVSSSEDQERGTGPEEESPSWWRRMLG